MKNMKPIDGLSSWDTFVIWIKEKLYTVLSTENLDKLTIKKEKELKALETVKELVYKDIRKELEEEFSDYYTEEEIDAMFKEIINE
jgi:hypothetical protein